MTYINRMYGRKAPVNQPTVEKNPNRVSGGLRAQGVDRLTMMAEDGSQKEIPTLEYVRSLEEQVKKQRAAMVVLERKLARQEASLQQVTAAISRRS